MCGISRRSSHPTNFENYYYEDEASDQTSYSEDEDEYDEMNMDKSTFNSHPKTQENRLYHRNVSLRLVRDSENDNTFRNRTKWKNYHYQAIPKALAIQEEDEEIAGPSTNSRHIASSDITTRTNDEGHLANDHCITIHVNGFEMENEQCSIDGQFYYDNVAENGLLVVACDNSSTSVV